MIVLTAAHTELQCSCMLKACDMYEVCMEQNVTYNSQQTHIQVKVFVYVWADKSSLPYSFQLVENDLPWVELATHIGPELHQPDNREYDVNTKRACSHLQDFCCWELFIGTLQSTSFLLMMLLMLILYMGESYIYLFLHPFKSGIIKKHRILKNQAYMQKCPALKCFNLL